MHGVGADHASPDKPVTRASNPLAIPRVTLTALRHRGEGYRYAAKVMWLPWKAALALAAALAIVPFLVVIGLFARPRHRGLRYALSFARETAVILGLYALWQFAGTLSLLKVNGAVSRGRWIFHFEQRVHLPGELWVQHLVLEVVAAHTSAQRVLRDRALPAMIAFLIWMFVRHRDRYPQVRNTMVIVTGAALAIQLIPVAPPRLTPGLGFVDTGALFHQSVYAAVGTPGPDQLSAMPSVHVAWSMLVGLGVVLYSTSRWRGWIIAHPAITLLAVVATGNHWWFDGIVSVQLIGVAIVVERSMHAVLTRLAARSAPAPRDPVDLDVAIPVALPSGDVHAEGLGLGTAAVEEHLHEPSIEGVGQHVVEREGIERVVERAREGREAL